MVGKNDHAKQNYSLDGRKELPGQNNIVQMQRVGKNYQAK